MAVPSYAKRDSRARASRNSEMERAPAAAGAHAAGRRRAEIAAPDREPAMALAREHAVRDVHAHPAFALDPHVGPGMARGRLVVAGIDVAADVTHGHVHRAAARDKQVRVLPLDEREIGRAHV